MSEHEKIKSVRDFMGLYRKREQVKRFTKTATAMWAFFLGEFESKEFPEMMVFSNSQLEEGAGVSKQNLFNVLDELKDRGMLEYAKHGRNSIEVRTVKGLTDKMESK